MNEDQHVDLVSRMVGIENEMKNIGILFSDTDGAGGRETY